MTHRQAQRRELLGQEGADNRNGRGRGAARVTARQRASGCIYDNQPARADDERSNRAAADHGFGHDDLVVGQRIPQVGPQGVGGPAVAGKKQLSHLSSPITLPCGFVPLRTNLALIL